MYDVDLPESMLGLDDYHSIGEHQTTGFAECPVCGHRDSDLFQITGDTNGQEIEVECPHCDSTFLVCCTVEATYSTRAM